MPTIRRRVLVVWPDGTWTDPILTIEIPRQGTEEARIAAGLENLSLQFPYNGALDLRDWGRPDHAPAERGVTAAPAQVEHISSVPNRVRSAGANEGHIAG